MESCINRVETTITELGLHLCWDHLLVLLFAVWKNGFFYVQESLQFTFHDETFNHSPFLTLFFLLGCVLIIGKK